MRKKIDSKVRATVLRLKKTKPHLGVRDIAEYFKSHYNLPLSKSAVAAILVSRGLKSRKGPKYAIALYKGRELTGAGLFLLAGVDQRFGLSGAAAASFARAGFTPLEATSAKGRLPLTGLANLIFFLSLAAQAGLSPVQAFSRKDLLRISGFKGLKRGQVKEFLAWLSAVQPQVEFSEVRRGMAQVSSIKLDFVNGAQVFCDAGMRTFFKGVCRASEFFLPLEVVRRNIAAMLSKNTLTVAYTKSFDYLSRECLGFLSGAPSGLRRVSALDLDGRTLEEFSVPSGKLSFVVGFYPKILSRGLSGLARSSRLKKIDLPLGGLYYSQAAAKTVAGGAQANLAVNVFLLKAGAKNSPAYWGLISDRQDPGALADYFYAWPCPSKDFIEGLALLENFFLGPKRASPDLDLPENFKVTSYQGLARLADISRDILHQQAPGLKLDCPGSLSSGKDFQRLYLAQGSLANKEKLNRAALYHGNKRLFLV